MERKERKNEETRDGVCEGAKTKDKMNGRRYLQRTKLGGKVC